MELSFLPEKLKSAVENLNADKLYELRLRRDFVVSVNYDGKKCFLSENGITQYEIAAIKCEKNDIDYVIDSLTERSIYAFNENIKKGFLTSKEGFRVGISGECVFDKDIVTVKNITSLNIRIPHDIPGSSDSFFYKIKNGDEFYNTLIISPPFCGKTTVLKDIALKINTFYDKNIFIIDERGEFSAVKGVRIDCLAYSDKLYAFEYGVRSMSPDIIITDELVAREDWECVYSAVNSGIKIISTCHAASIDEIKRKIFFNSNIFNRYVVLKGNEFGKLLKVYDGDFNEV